VAAPTPQQPASSGVAILKLSVANLKLSPGGPVLALPCAELPTQRPRVTGWPPPPSRHGPCPASPQPPAWSATLIGDTWQGRCASATLRCLRCLAPSHRQATTDCSQRAKPMLRALGKAPPRAHCPR